jgi:hypothetical protein
MSGFFLLFPLYKIGGQEDGTGPALGRLAPLVCWGGSEMWRRMNTVQILCTHVCKWKNDICWNYSRNGEVKENGGKGEIKYDIFDISSELLQMSQCTLTQHK